MNPMMTESWLDLDNQRPSFRVPSLHHQTLLSKALFEHARSVKVIAAVAASSRAIQNSSLAAGLTTSIPVFFEPETRKLFMTVFHPSNSETAQFVPFLRFSYTKQMGDYFSALKRTKYFARSLRRLEVEMPSPRLMCLLDGMVGLQELRLEIWRPRKEDIPFLNKTNLISLRQFECNLDDETTDADMEYFCQMVPDLIYSMDLSFSSITAQGLRMLCQNLTNLSSLDLSHTTKIYFQDLGLLANCASTLTHLDLGYSPNFFRDDCLLALQPLTSLKLLVVGSTYTTQISPEAKLKLKEVVPGIEIRDNHSY